MAKVLLQSFAISSFTTAVTKYSPIGSTYCVVGATETDQQTLFRTGGVLSLFTLNVPSNDLTGTSTIKIRKNGADGASAISVGAGATGLFYDLANIESVAAGDKFCYQFALGSGGSNFWMGTAEVVYDASDKTVLKIAPSNTPASTSVDSTSRFHTPNGQATWQLSETGLQSTMRIAGTLKNMFVNVTANGRSTATIFGSRVNTANGALAVSIGAGVTGFVEDTSNSDTIASGDIVGLRRLTSTGGGTITFTNVGMEIVTVDRTTMMCAGTTAGVSTAAATTTYFGISGVLASFSESWTNAPVKLLQRASNLTANVSANTINTGNTTLKLRKNTANGNQVISVAAAATGVVTDASGVDVLLPADRVAYQLITSGASGSFAMTWTSMKVKYLDQKEMIGSGIVPVGR